MRVRVRNAAPTDGPAVQRVHLSTVEQWTDPDGTVRGSRAALESSTPFERFLWGGPWMDPGLCSQHIAQVLESGQWALVALDPSGVPVGELEVIVEDTPSWGRIAHLDVLAVERSVQGRGIGAALVEEARSRAVHAGCSRLTTNPEGSAVGFYRRCGFSEVLARQVDVRLPIGTAGTEGPHAVPTGRPVGFSDVKDLDLALGRFQTSYATWIKGTWQLEGVADRLRREEGTVEDRGAFYRLWGSGREPDSVWAYLWTDRDAPLAPVLAALLRRAGHLGYRTLETTIDAARTREVAELAAEERGGSVILGAPIVTPA